MLLPTQFHCYLVQKTQWNAVFHPAKLASGANYPVGWVQMPHSLRSGEGEGALGKGKDLGGSRERSHPGVQSPRLFRFDLRVRATAEPRLFLTCIYPACFLFKDALFTAGTEPGATQYSHNHPPVANEQLDWLNKRLRLTRTQTKPICVFLHDG